MSIRSDAVIVSFVSSWNYDRVGLFALAKIASTKTSHDSCCSLGATAHSPTKILNWINCVRWGGHSIYIQLFWASQYGQETEQNYTYVNPYPKYSRTLAIFTRSSVSSGRSFYCVLGQRVSWHHTWVILYLVYCFFSMWLQLKWTPHHCSPADFFDPIPMGASAH